MIKALIVDDEPLARARIRRMLRDETDIEIIGECTGGAEAVSFVNQNQPDLIFLDIQMPEMNGFEVLQTIYSPQMPLIIFVTAFDKYAIKAFEFHALDYLLKPFTPERLQSAIKRAREQLKKNQKDNFDQRILSLLSNPKDAQNYLDRIMLRSSGRIYFLKTEEIDWIEASGNYINLHVGKEGHLLRETMSNIETRLDPSKFIRIHRSAIVNINSISELHPLFTGDYALFLRDNTELILSRHYRDRFIQLFEK